MSETFSFEEGLGQAAAPPPQGMATITVTAPQPSGTFSWEDAKAPPPQSAADRPAGKTGMAANAAAGVIEGAGDVMNTAADPFGNLIGRPIAAGIAAAHDWLAPKFGGKPFTPEDRAYLLGDDVPQPGTRITGAIGSALGAPSTEDVQPADRAQAFMRAGARGATGMAGFLAAGAVPSVSATAKALALGATAGAAGGMAGQAVNDSDAIPDAAKPLLSMGANFLAGGGIIGSVAATRAALDAATSRVGNYLAPLTESGRQRMAGQQIASAATDLPAVRDALANPQPELVPGSQPTTFQLTGDQGLGNLERVAAKNAPDQFLTRANQQNAARVGAVQGLGSADASPEAVGTAFRAALDQQNAAQEAAIAGARTYAQGATDAMGGSFAGGAESALQQQGEALRARLAAGDAAAKANVSRLANAIDPDGTLNVSMQPVRQAGRAIMQALPRNAAPMQGEEAGIFNTVNVLPDVQPFAELGALNNRITTAMRAARQDPAQAATYARLSQLRGSLAQVMQGAVEDAASKDAAAVQAGTLGPDAAIMGRLNQWHQDASPAPSPAGAAQVAPGADIGAGVGGSATGTPFDAAGLRSPAGASGGGPGNFAGNPGLQSKARTAVGPAPQSLLSFLVSKGGIQDQGGELAAMDAGKGRPGLVRSPANGPASSGGRLAPKNGLSLDYAREAAEQAGYLPPGSDVNDLLDAISDELHGRKVYEPGAGAAYQARAEDARAAARNRDLLDQARDAVLHAEDDWGGRLSPDELEHATQLTATGMHPEEAISQATMAGEHAALDRLTQRQAFGLPGVPAGAEQADFGLGGGNGLRANFDADAAARYQAMRQAHAERMGTYRNAPGVGEMLAPGPTAGTFAMDASRIPSIFTGGKGVAEKVQAYLRAGGDRRALGDALAFDLRRTAENTDGILDRAKYQRWMSQHAEALSQLPEVAQRFQTAAVARQTLDEITARAVQARQAFEKSAAAKFLGDADPVTTVGRILHSGTALSTMQQLARMTVGSPAARAGLRQAVVEYILRDLRGNAAAGDTGTTLLKSDAFQTFVRKTPQALSTIFTSAEIENMRAVAADLQRANKSIAGTKLPGGSNTAQDLAAGKAHETGGHGQSALGSFLVAEAIEHMAEHFTGGEGLLGLAAQGAGIGVIVLNAMRHAGLTKVDDLVTQAMLHPALARTLLMKVNPSTTPFIAAALPAQLRALAMESAQPPSTKRSPSGAAPGLATPTSAPAVSVFR